MAFEQYLKSLKDEKSKGKYYLTTQYEDSDDEDAEQEDIVGGKRKRLDSEDSEPSLDASPTASSSSSSSESKLASSFGSGSEELDTDIDPEGLSQDYYPPPIDPVLPRPTDALADDFPLQPDLMGNLVLQQTNLWLGNSTNGKSSGLHHDFHDNLYALIAGRKRFLLFPPNAFQHLRPRGVVERVHANGLIEYTPRGDVHVDHPTSSRLPLRSDGLPPSEAARWRFLARRSAVAAFSQEAAASSGEAHLPTRRRKGKSKMSPEQELALERYEEAVEEVTRWLAIEAEQDEEDASGQEGDELVYQTGGDATSSSQEESSEEDEGSSDEENGDRPVDPRMLHALFAKALRGDRMASEIIRNLMSGEDEAPASDSDEEGDEEEESGSEIETAEEEFTGFSDEDDNEDEDDRNDGNILRIPRRPGNLPGGLRRDDQDDSYDEYSDYDEVVPPGAHLLVDSEDEEAEGRTLGGETGEAALMMENLEFARIEALQRIRPHVQWGQHMHPIPTLLQEVLPAPGRRAREIDSEDEDESQEVSSDNDEERAGGGSGPSYFAGLPAPHSTGDDGEAAIMAVTRDGQDTEDDDSEDASDEGNEDDDAMPVFGDAEPGDSESDEGDSDEDGSAEEGGVFGTGNLTDGSDWGGDLDDGEAALEALAAQDRGSQNVTQKPSERRSATNEDKEPLSFSKIAPKTLHQAWMLKDSLDDEDEDEDAIAEEYTAAKYKPGKKCPTPILAELRPGEMLYLPASWWHEVTSQAAPSTDKDAASNSDVHMALNWWFHPPDNLSSPAASSKGGSRRNAAGPGGGAAAAASSAASSKPNGQFNVTPDPFDEPYADSEVWGQIRQEVRRQLDKARERAQRRKQSDALASSSSKNPKAKKVKVNSQ